MKKREINITGRINHDGKLVMYMGELKEFASQWKDTRITATFRVYQPGTSAALRGYYYNCVVPTVQRALWETGDRKTKEQTEQWLREISPIMYRESDPEAGRYVTELREIDDLDNSELIEHIDTLKQFCAEELNVYIEDPNTI